MLSTMCCLLVVCLAAQDNPHKPLKIGDQVPDMLLSPLANYKERRAHLSQFRGRLVILDFWATNCQGCIRAFPHMEELQKKFGSDLQILLVNTQSQQQIDHTFEVVGKTIPDFRKYRPRLPSLTSDQQLNALFPHYYIPHEVWISAQGKVIAITDEKAVTEENIRSAISGGPFHLRQKNDLLWQDLHQALLPQIYSSFKDSIVYYSILIKGIDGIRTDIAFHSDTLKKTVRISRPTVPILELYADALTQSEGFDHPFKNANWDYGKRVVLEVSDSSRYLWDGKGNYADWAAEHTYAYEAVLPLHAKDKLYEDMVADYNRYFSLHGRMENRKMKCLALVRTSEEDKIRYKGPHVYHGAVRIIDSNNAYHLNGSELDLLRESLSEYKPASPYPIVDHTGYTDWADITITAPLNDLEKVRAELRARYDLDLVEMEAVIPVMVLTENDYHKQLN